MDKMRKILWYGIIALPLIAYVCAMRAGTDVAFATLIGSFVPAEPFEAVYNAISGWIGTNGMFPLLSDGMICYFLYFCAVELVHIVMDVLLFIPSICHSLFEKLGNKKGDM